MKNFILTIAIVLGQLLVIAQCPQGDIIFSSQADIDNFPINYPNCTEFEGSITFTGSAIINLYGLGALASIGGDLNFLYTVALSSPIGLQNLTSVGGALMIVENYTFNNLFGLNNLSSIGGDLIISQNNLQTSLNGLNNLASIGNSLYIDSSPSLTNIAGLQSLNSIGNAAEIVNCPALTSITGLENLASVGGYLSIEYNDLLTSLDGFEALTSIGEKLSIQNNNVLTSISGLESLTSIGGELSVRSNYALTSLTGLDNIDAASIGDLKIYSNTSLNTCEVWSVCNYLGSPNGTILINNNATGCNNQQEVEDACDIVSVNEISPNNKLTIYPNPTSSSLTIEISNIPYQNAYLGISNTNGQQLITQELTASKIEIDISHLPKGIYIVRFQSGKEIITQKLVVN
jgi:hypothetical protein